MRACILIFVLLIGAAPAAGQSAAEEKFDPVVVRKQLQSPDAQVRMDALMAIGAHRKDARGLVDALLPMLTHRDLPTRYLAAYTLAAVDPKRAAPALPILKAMLRSDVEMNGSSPRILGPSGLGWLGRPGADALVEALADADPKTRIAAAQGLMNSDVFPPEAVPALLKAMRGSDRLARHQAMVALVERKPPAERMIKPLVDALIDEDSEMRAGAAVGLGQYRREAIRALDALKQAAKDPDEYTAISAAAAVALIDKASGLELLPMFIAELSRPEGERFAAISGDLRLFSVAAALAALGPDAGPALPALSRAFEREKRASGWATLDLGFALALIDPGSAGPVIAWVIEDLEKSHDHWRYMTLVRLPELGKIAAAAAPAVAKLTSSPDPQIREAATKALAAIR